MASICKDPNGKKRIVFTSPDGVRKSLWLGKMTVRLAETVKQKVERIIATKITGTPLDDDTAKWIAKLDDTLSNKLMKAGLIHKRDSVTLQKFIDGYIESRSDVKSATIITYHNARRNLIKFFGPNKPLRDINPGDADDFRLFLLKKEKLSENTARKRSGCAKQFFRAAMKRELIQRNPFSELITTLKKNTERQYFVTREEAEKVIESCIDSQWRLLFALSRFGGLRCPSEHLCLKWGDVLWGENKLVVRSPKTEHHEGKEFRIIPIFPELRPHLEEVFELAEPGSEYVITRYRDSNQNLRTQLLRTIAKAGLKPWPKLWHNLRSTRETELAEKYPLHVVCEWIGNSQLIAAKHYLQVTDDHFSEATQEPVEKTARNTAQQSADGLRNDLQADNDAQEKTPVLQGVSTDCNWLQSVYVGPEGLEPPTKRL